VEKEQSRARASAENFPGGGRATEKRPKISIKIPKNSTIQPLPGGAQRKKFDK